jgi:hypothetical protein
MPELDFAVVCDFVRADGGVAHIIGGGFEEITVDDTPTAHNMGLWARVLLARSECDRPHRLELIFQTADGERLTEISGPIERDWPDNQSAGIKVGVGIAFNFGVSLPELGTYSLEILLNDSLVKSIPLLVQHRDDE